MDLLSSKTKNRILILYDRIDLLNKLRELLPEEDYELVITQHMDEGITLLQHEQFDLVITDLIMSGMSGSNVLAYIRTNCPDTLVVVIIGHVPLESVIQAIRDGAYDFITKPIQSHMLKAAINRAFENIKLQRQLAEATHKLQLQAITDELTSLHNVRYFNERLEIEFERARRYNIPLSCIMVDVDYFKDINDKCGHLKGDEVLKRIAQIIKDSVRGSDLAARYGGDEFALLLPQTNLQSSQLLAKRIKEGVSEFDFSNITDEFTNVSISLGICSFPHNKIKHKKDLIKLADEALYSAKQEDRVKLQG
jgi:two-component system cell cycle response regulator